jgi:hypothetical protein
MHNPRLGGREARRCRAGRLRWYCRNFNIVNPGHLDATVSRAAPVVFVIDDDLSAREALELLIRLAGWQPRTFAFVRHRVRRN